MVHLCELLSFLCCLANQTEARILGFSGAINIQEEMDMACKGNYDEQLPQLHEPKEPEKARRKGKVNLRKSLAWDTAFFTDAGSFCLYFLFIYPVLYCKLKFTNNMFRCA